MKVFLVAGARPNFMKIAPIYRASLTVPGVDCRIVHTGQHYDHEMSQAFFDDLEIPQPQYFLDAGSGSHAVQTAKIMVAFEKICESEKPDLVLVVGDVNSTLACSIVAKKLLIKVAHVEAGLRSFDLSMPEEINRMVTDAISDYFFVTEESGKLNLLREGRSVESVHFVGHVMIDNLLYQLENMKSVQGSTFNVQGLKAKGQYAFMTLHRPSNVDDKNTFLGIAGALNEIAKELIILFPVHPRTKKMMEQFNIHFSDNIKLLPPLGFKESLFLWKDAKIVLTDSGGLQEETTALGIPCVTIRENTERPITVELGTNVLAGTTKEGILKAYEQCFAKVRTASIPPLWDGKAAERIWEVIKNSFK
ncbi:MAG: UDP-N-acetylglucosamine 2-epimerase (non-hydrolyzing) [Deltaproteobacteria bacterium HGW-Deltaproteobacteria-13]|jgi:UDP-N-acetylglucosamine 2-epimerase (non-hydrolysing)|nr:MAG: UDP-N-acetylglucosamine 2-epimerase (non-hydrolyzing) [Deltaproteobacteria bacterium HGW-Deltaproteobacteria-13]